MFLCEMHRPMLIVPMFSQEMHVLESSAHENTSTDNYVYDLTQQRNHHFLTGFNLDSTGTVAIDSELALICDFDRLAVPAR
jgi:hypothetical protein